MNPNNHNMFDELVKQKLEDYSETPDMQLMQRIHTKKNRINQWYGLYSILIITTAIGLGILGTYMFGVHFHQEAMVEQAPNKVYHLSVAAASESVAPVSNISPSKMSETSNLSTVHQSNNTPNGFHSSITSVKQSTKTEQHHSPLSTTHQKVNKYEFANQTSTLPQPNSNNTPINQKPTETNKSKTGKAEASCKSVFNYYASFNGDINFSNFSEGDNALSYSWDFGDGTSSAQATPTHTYKREGEYYVQLTVKDNQGCINTDNKTIVYKSNTNKNAVRSTLKGVVKAGNNPVSNALVELYSANTNENSGYYLVRTNNNGEFTLINLIAGRYILRAAPTDNTPNYLLTYWGNQSDYNNAPEVVVTQNYDEHLIGYSIDLVYKGMDIVTTNPVLIGDNGEHQVLILDANNNVVGSGTIDANGKLSVPNDFSGHFKVLDKQTGQLSGSIDLSGNNNQGSSGILHAPSAAASMTLNPNPATNSVNINLQSVQGEASSIMVMDANGKEMFSAELAVGIGSNQVPIDISKLPGGVYYVVVMLRSGAVISTRLMKSDNQDR